VLGVRSMISVAIPVHDGHCSMNYFAADPHSFDHFDVDAAGGARVPGEGLGS